MSEGWFSGLKNGLSRTTSRVTSGIAQAVAGRRLDKKALQALENPKSTNRLMTQYGAKPNTSIGVIRLAVLSQALRSMTSSGGLAPQLQALVEPAISALERIGDISLALEFTESTLRLSITETLP